jgi:hypothetical protein
VRALTAALDLDGWAIVERLLKDLAPLKDRLWLVIDDAHLLGHGGVLPQLEQLLLSAPAQLRFVLVTRHGRFRHSKEDSGDISDLAGLRAGSAGLARPRGQRPGLLRRRGGAEPVLDHRRRLPPGAPDDPRARSSQLS